VTYNPAFTWPIAFATWAVLAGLAWARRRRRRGRTAPPVQARMSRPPALHGEDASDEPAYGSIYHVSPAPGEGGENT
jgi:uncharacterized protein (TIGR03382 family)